MSEVFVQPPRQTNRSAVPFHRTPTTSSVYRDPAMILIAALGISFITLMLVTGWLLINS